MPSRRSHTKSHHGCKQCKQRRVKCGEELPACQRCVKRHIICSFIDDHTESFPTPPPSTTTSDPVSQLNGQAYQSRECRPHPMKVVLPPQQSLSGIAAPSDLEKKFDILDIELIQHYCTRTYLTISSRLSTHVIWRDAVFREAFRHEWLLHGIMATAALHKASTLPKSSQDYAKVALAHQNAALAGYIPAVSQPDQDNSIAVFSLSLLLTIWAFASKALPEGLKLVGANAATSDPNLAIRIPLASPTLQFTQIITILRGIYTVMQETDTWLQGDIEEMLRYPRDADLPQHPPEVDKAYDVLVEAVENFHDPDVLEFKELCIESANKLRTISRCRSVVEWDGHIFSFIIMSPIAYFDCIKQGNPMALAVFAYWAACFRCMDHHWWANGWPQALVHDISTLLDMRVWSKAMEWPMRQCGLLFQDGHSFEPRKVH